MSPAERTTNLKESPDMSEHENAISPENLRPTNGQKPIPDQKAATSNPQKATEALAEYMGNSSSTDEQITIGISSQHIPGQTNENESSMSESESDNERERIERELDILNLAFEELKNGIRDFRVEVEVARTHLNEAKAQWVEIGELSRRLLLAEVSRLKF